MNIVEIFSAKPIVSSVAGLVLVGGIGFGFQMAFSEMEYKEIPVVRKNIQTSVFFSGSVVPADRVTLSFERTGQIASIPVSVGESVSAGQSLLRLNTDTAAALLQEAEAQVAVEEAALSILIEGTREEEIAISQKELEAQITAVLDAEQEVKRTITDVFSDVDAAIYTYTDQMFTDPQSNNPELTFAARDTVRQSALEASRKDIGVRIENIRVRLALQSVTEQEMDSILSDISSYLGELAFLLANRVPAATPVQATVDGWQSNIAVARGNIESSQTTLLGKEIALRAAGAKESVLKQKLALLEAGSTPQSISEQKARLAKSAAAVSRYAAELQQHILRSPISGVVSDIAVDLGELAQVNAPAIEILSEGSFVIEADVSELDLPFIKVGDVAEITFDAYRDSFVISGTIVSIDPAEKIVNGVPAYGVTLHIGDDSGRVRSGLTANMVISSVEREEALTLPIEAFVEIEGEPHVLFDTGEARDFVRVEVGIQGRDGTVEVITPLKEGDIVFVEK